MGKSCIRFKKPEHIPYKLIGELIKKVTVKDWIRVYEQALSGKIKNLKNLQSERNTENKVQIEP